VRKKVALAIMSVFVIVAVLEGLVRIIAPQDLSFFDSGRFERFSSDVPTLRENIPNSRSDSYIGVPVSINHLGLRGDDISLQKPPKTVRIIGIGDSIAFGYGVKVESTFLKLLERSLNQSADGDLRYQVLNAGVPATGLDYYQHFMVAKAPALQADAVIISVCLNDIHTYRHSSTHRISRQTNGRVRTAAMFLSRHSQLFLLLYLELKTALYRLGILDINRIEGAELLTLEPPSPAQEQSWESSLHMLGEIVKTAQSQKIPLLLVLFPLEMQLSPQMLQLYRDKFRVRLGPEAVRGDPQEKLRAFANQNGVPLLDLLPAFRENEGSTLYLRNKSTTYDPVHPSEVGNQIAAREILRFMECSDPGWLPRPGLAGTTCSDAVTGTK
jgi:lysophospholipase L1-like esterase